jgi:hypothetical protein
VRPDRPASPFLALGALLIAGAIACRPAATPIPPEQSYFPLRLGQRWVYDTTFYGPTQRATTSVVAVCRVGEGEGGRMFLISTCADEQLVEAQIVFERGEEIAQPILLNSQGEPRPRDPPEVIARTRMRVGQVWQWAGTVGEDERESVYAVTNRGRVMTPAGEIQAVRLLVRDLSAGPAEAAVERWFAPGIGLVREAGAVTFTGEGGQMAQIELVRTLREHGVVAVGSIPCCGKVPSQPP